MYPPRRSFLELLRYSLHPLRLSSLLKSLVLSLIVESFLESFGWPTLRPPGCPFDQVLDLNWHRHRGRLLQLGRIRRRVRMLEGCLRWLQRLGLCLHLQLRWHYRLLHSRLLDLDHNLFLDKNRSLRWKGRVLHWSSRLNLNLNLNLCRDWGRGGSTRN